MVVNNVTFVLDSHAHFNDYIKEPIDGILYNLGYLPAGNKTLVTKSYSTVESLKRICFFSKQED